MTAPFTYRLLFVMLACLGQALSHAQPDKPTDLSGVGSSLKDTDKINRLNSQSETFRITRRLDSSRSYAIQAARLSKASQYVAGLVDAWLNLAIDDYELGRFAAMETVCKGAIRLLSNYHDEKRLAKAYVLLGQAIWAQSRFDQAKELFDKASHIFIRYNDSINLGRTYALMALAEEERGNYEQSFQYCIKASTLNPDAAYLSLGQLYADVGDYETALESYNKIRQRYRIDNYLKIGELYFLKQQYDSAQYYYQLYYKNNRGLSPKMLSKANALQGALYLKLKDFNTALGYLTDALANFKEDNNRNWIMRVLLELGKAYQQTGNTHLAIKTLRKLLATARASGARQYTRDAHYLLYQLYSGLKQDDHAYSHLKQYTNLSHAIDIDLSARKLAFYKTSHEREQAQLNIALLNKQRQLQQEELKQTAQQRTFLVIGTLALVCLGLVLFRNTLLKKREEKHLRELAENELHIQKLETKKQLGELEMQVLRTQMNPHFIFNSLNSINRFILQNNKAQAAAYLTKFSRLVRMILQNSQNKLITLAEELESLELYLNLEALRFDNHFSYAITVDEELDGSTLKVPPLLIQPYVENAIWHGLMHKEEKGDLQIDVFLREEWVYIRILDNGIGRPRAGALSSPAMPNHKSMGLGITSQRIAMVQAGTSQEPAVVINDLVDPSGTPSGTEVLLKLPLLYD